MLSLFGFNSCPTSFLQTLYTGHETIFKFMTIFQILVSFIFDVHNDSNIQSSLQSFASKTFQIDFKLS